jgi:hypothetical protein
LRLVWRDFLGDPARGELTQQGVQPTRRAVP